MGAGKLEQKCLISEDYSKRKEEERSNRAKRGNRWQAKGQRVQDYKAETYFA